MIDPPFVRLVKLLRVPPQRVYDAWMDPAQRRQWWGASEEMTCHLCEIDARVGGSYRVGITHGSKQMVACGQFLQLDPPRRIQSTWRWENDPDNSQQTIVTLDLIETLHDGKPATELILTHEQLPNAFARSEHCSGWFGCLRQLGFHFHGRPAPLTPSR